MLWFSDPVLGTIEEKLLEEIVNFRLPLPSKTVCFRDLQNKIKVIFSDERKFREEAAPDRATIDSQIEDIHKHISSVLDQQKAIFRKLHEIGEQIDDAEYQRMRKESGELEQLLGQLSRTEYNLIQIRDGAPNITYFLGEFCSDPEPTVTIYYKNFDTPLWLGLSAVFVHEMFHAWFYFEAENNNRTVPEVDEPLVEYSTLYFLSQICRDLEKLLIREHMEMTRCFEWQKGSVLQKQTAYGLTAAYGFGRYIFDALSSVSPDNGPKWIEAYSTISASIKPTDSIPSAIARSLNPAYPFNNEKAVFTNFQRLLFGRVSSTTRKAKATMTFRSLLLACIDVIGKTDFNLSDIYKFLPVFQAAYPDNAHIREKIRQALQQLVHEGILTRISNGEYHVN